MIIFNPTFLNNTQRVFHFYMVQFFLLPSMFKQSIPLSDSYIHSIQTMNSNEIKKNLSNESNTLSTQNQPPSPTSLSSPFVSLSSSMPELIFQKKQPYSPQRIKLGLECYFIDFDQMDRKYHTIKVNQQSSGNFLSQITDLILSYTRTHIKKISQSSPLPPPTSPSKIMKPIIFPVFDSKLYAFVFQTDDKRIVESGLEISDRFLIIICDHFLPYTLSEMVKNIVSKIFSYIEEQFEDRPKNLKKQEEKERTHLSLSSRRSLLQKIDAFLHTSKKFYFSKQKQLQLQLCHQQQWYFRDLSTYSILIRLNSLHYHPMLLLTLLLYYTIREYKIILLGGKQNRHIMSENALGLKASLLPIQYCYPLIFTIISNDHDDYIDAPVPCLICYWGEEKECNKIKKKYRKIQEDNHMPTILIDLDNFTAFNSITNEYQSKIMIQINRKIIGAKNQEGSIIDRAKRYVRENLVDCKKQEFKLESQLFKRTLAYQNYQQSL